MEEGAAFLERTHFLKDGTLTERGKMATEIHEAHPLVLALAVEDRLFDGLDQDDLVLAMAAFLEPPSGADEPFMEHLGLPIPAQSALVCLGHVARVLASEETVKSPEGYWTLHTFWIPAVREWLNGTLPADVQEGTFVRTMLKLCNILDELQTVLTMRGHTAVLDTLQGAKHRILRDMVRPESLYLGL